MRPDLKRLCNADHRTAEEWMRNAWESIGHELPRAGFAWTSNETRCCGYALTSSGIDKQRNGMNMHRNSFECNAAEKK